MTYQNAQFGRYGMNGGRVRVNDARIAGKRPSAPRYSDRSAARNDETARRRAAENAARKAAYAAEMRRIEREKELAYYKFLKRKDKEEKKAEKKENRKAERIQEKRERLREEAELKRREVRVEKQRISVSFVITVMIIFVMLMAVIFSFSELSSSSAELSRIKDEIALVEEEASKLSLQLEQKNDVNVIEQMATEKLMMVREDSVQRKYISNPTGDRIVLEADEIVSESAGPFDSMLSSFSAMFDDVLDYFR